MNVCYVNSTLINNVSDCVNGGNFIYHNWILVLVLIAISISFALWYDRHKFCGDDSEYVC